MDRPRPDDEPVTMAVRPSNDKADEDGDGDGVVGLVVEGEDEVTVMSVACKVMDRMSVDGVAESRVDE